jgi:hypothetical protein
VEQPWRVTDVELRVGAGEVEVKVEHMGPVACPACGAAAKRHDTRLRRWRHLPTCQFKTILAAEVPRVRCPEHGVKTLAVPWSEPDSGFTALFEALVIDWLHEASIQAVARRLDLSWDQVDGVMQRAVRRGLARRRLEVPRRLGVDETSFQKRVRICLLLENAVSAVCAKLLCGALYLDGAPPKLLIPTRARSVTSAFSLMKTYGRQRSLSRLRWNNARGIHSNLSMTLSPADDFFRRLRPYGAS